jgi:hypothetical protein
MFHRTYTLQFSGHNIFRRLGELSSWNTDDGLEPYSAHHRHLRATLRITQTLYAGFIPRNLLHTHQPSRYRSIPPS